MIKIQGPHLRHILSCLQRGEDTIIMQGGRRSGKTWSILQYIIARSLEQPNTRTLVVSQTLSRLRESVLADLAAIQGANTWYRISRGTSPRVDFSNGSGFDFLCADRDSRGYASRYSFIFLNECIMYDWQVARNALMAAGASAIIFADYNPYTRFWCQDYLEHYNPDGACTNKLITTYRDNLMLPDGARKQLEIQAERGKDAAPGTIERYRYEVECLGIDSSLSGRVYPDCEIIEDKEWEQIAAPIIIGFDWGYTHALGDPDAACAVKIAGGTIYLQELYYTNHAGDRELAGVLEAFATKHPEQERMVAVYDPATNGEGRIRNFISMGAPRAWRYTAAKKLPIMADLRNLAGVRLAITKTSPNALREQREYIWTDTGGVLAPVDKYNHIMDAMRYAYNYALTSSR